MRSVWIRSSAAERPVSALLVVRPEPVANQTPSVATTIPTMTATTSHGLPLRAAFVLWPRPIVPACAIWMTSIRSVRARCRPVGRALGRPRPLATPYERRHGRDIERCPDSVGDGPFISRGLDPGEPLCDPPGVYGSGVCEVAVLRGRRAPISGGRASAARTRLPRGGARSTPGP